MAKQALKVAPGEAADIDDPPFIFPALTQERAAEIADEIVIESEYDKYIMTLVVELALGLAPAGLNAVNNTDRADAAHAFASQMFRNMPGFDACVRTFIREVAEQAKGGDSR